MLHNLKINKEFFSPVKERIKTFEIRKNDRNFQVGDQIVLNEWDEKISSILERRLMGKLFISQTTNKKKIM